MTFDPDWERVHREVGWGSMPDVRFTRFVREHFRDRASVFLELGCGAGAQAIWLAEQGFTVVAVDGSATALVRMLSRSKGKMAIDGWLLKLMAVRADITMLEARPSSIDCVLDICALQHTSFCSAAFAVDRARSWIKPGGWFYSCMATEPFPRHLNRTSYLRTVTRSEAVAMFSGYKIVGAERDDRLHEGSGELVPRVAVEARTE